MAYHQLIVAAFEAGTLTKGLDASRTSDGEAVLDRGKHLRAMLVELRKALDTLPNQTPSLASHEANQVSDPLEDA
jgi:hypothetical protein